MKLFHFFELIISILYGSVVHIRNFLFDIGIFNQKKFESKIIGVGNISVGGTGKTVLIDYFSKYLNNKKIWNIINWIIIFIMSVITLYVLREIIYSINL